MKAEAAPIKDVFIIIPDVLEDDRGFFAEIYKKEKFEALGLDLNLVQENYSRSKKGVIRGLHFQWDPPMAKLMRVSRGRAFLVAVDLRKKSPTFGKWFGLEASEDDKKQLYAPASFARGFCALSDVADVQYLCTAVYNPKGESGILWNDPRIGITWPVDDPMLSEKDKNAQTLEEWLARPESNCF